MMKVAYSPECLDYDVPGHPESPDRVRAIHDELKRAGYAFTPAAPASVDDILLAHTREYYEKIRDGRYGSMDVPLIDVKYPMLSAGVAIKASRILGFALTRPPGHHAGRDSEAGFCYFNNIAIAVKKLGKRTAILDIDVHHGNGTQSIFLGSSDVLYVSLHQLPLFPMSGFKTDQNCHNFPLFPGTDEKTYLKTLEKALPVVERFRPEVLAVSVGFDSYKEDTLVSGQAITEKGYGKIGRMISGLSLPTFMTFEGGYNVADIGRLCRSFLDHFP